MRFCGALLISLALGIIVGDSLPRPPLFREVSYHVGKGPRWITVADVNRDKNPDILVANADAGTITVLLGDGQGQFHEASNSPVAAGHLPNDIAVADMNGDGNPDLIVANHQAPTITILLGDGTGTFRPAPGTPINVHSNPHPHAVAVADFNGDGKPDVVTDSWAANQVELLLGNGDGSVRTPGRFFAVGHRPYERLLTADFNRDGHPDIVTTNLDDGTITILLGDGKGAFSEAPGSPFAAGAKPWQAFAGDVSGDAIPDLVVIPYQRDIASPTQSAVTILVGDGRGAFKPMAGSPLPLSKCVGPNSVSGGMLDSNRPVIVVACAQSRNMMLYELGVRGHPDPVSIPIKGGWGSVALARLTKDARAQLITANNEDASITVYFPN